MCVSVSWAHCYSFQTLVLLTILLSKLYVNTYVQLNTLTRYRSCNVCSHFEKANPSLKAQRRARRVVLVPRLVLTQPASAIPTWHRHIRGQMQFKPITMAGWSLMWCLLSGALLCTHVDFGRYHHNTVVFILAKEYNLKNLWTNHRVNWLTSGQLMFGRNP